MVKTTKLFFPQVESWILNNFNKRICIKLLFLILSATPFLANDFVLNINGSSLGINGSLKVVCKK